MHDETSAFVGTARERARQQAHHGAERVSRCARWKLRPINHEAGPQRHPRIERAPCHVYPCADGLTQKAQHEAPREQPDASATAPCANRRRLAHVAAAAANAPTRRSMRLKPERTSQNPKKPAARTSEPRSALWFTSMAL